MEHATTRGWQAAMVLAFAGSLVAVVAGILPWYTVQAGDFGHGIWSAAALLGAQPQDADSAQAMLDASAPLIAAHMRDGLHGYSLEHLPWAMARQGVAVVVITVALAGRIRLVRGVTPFAVFFAAAAFFAIRPAIYLLEPPGTKFTTLYHHTPGLYLSFVASGLLVLAALLTCLPARAGALAPAGTDGAPEPAPVTGLTA